MDAVFPGIAVFFVSGIVQGVTGFGFGLVAMPLLTLFMPLRTAVPLVMLFGLVSTVQIATVERRHIPAEKVWIVALSGVAASFLGSVVLAMVSSRMIRLAAGPVIIAFAAAMAAGLKTRGEHEKLFQVIAGLFAGILNGTVSLPGPPLVILYTFLGLDKRQFKAAVAVSVLPVVLSTLFFQVLLGLFTREILLLGAFFLLPCVVGIHFGGRITDRLSAVQFRYAGAILTALTGIVLFAGAIR